MASLAVRTVLILNIFFFFNAFLRMCSEENYEYRLIFTYYIPECIVYNLCCWRNGNGTDKRIPIVLYSYEYFLHSLI